MSEIADLYNDSYHNNFKKVVEENKQLKTENKKLKDTIKEMEDDLDDWISDVSILYTYDDGKPNNLDELQCCMEHVHEEWSKYKQCLDEIEGNVKDLKNECFYEDFECADCDMTFACNYHKKCEILQLIKQTKGGGNDKM